MIGFHLYQCPVCGQCECDFFENVNGFPTPFHAVYTDATDEVRADFAHIGVTRRIWVW